MGLGEEAQEAVGRHHNLIWQRQEERRDGSEDVVACGSNGDMEICGTAIMVRAQGLLPTRGMSYAILLDQPSVGRAITRVSGDH